MISALMIGSRSSREEASSSTSTATSSSSTSTTQGAMGAAVSHLSSARASSHSATEGGEETSQWHVVAELCPVRSSMSPDGAVIRSLSLGTELRVDERSSGRLPTPPSGRAAQRMHEQARGLEWLRTTDPVVGWCLASQCAPGEYARLGASWRFVVVCQDGAYVREGLELASPHMYTLSKDAVFGVRERRVNEQGLARLRTDDGWISEDLNPLSGQRGPIALLLPLSKPLEYRVVLGDGAVVRETVELSSAVVRVVPAGDVVVVDDKQFSDHPAQHCVPRLRLIRPVRGWISQRLNREPPDDLVVVELVGVASGLDENDQDQDQDQDDEVSRGTDDAGTPDRVVELRPNDDTRTAQAAPASSARTARTSNDRPASAALDPTPPSERARRDLDRSGFFSPGRRLQHPAGSSTNADDPSGADPLCVVCLSAPRNSTFVHGETGHIACCLSCARTLKARGDTCPVCRMTIERVIQHFRA